MANFQPTPDFNKEEQRKLELHGVDSDTIWSLSQVFGTNGAREELAFLFEEAEKNIDALRKKIRHLNRLKAHGFNKRAIEELIQSEGGEKNLEDLKLLFLTEDQEQAIDLRTKLHAILEPKEIGEKLAKITFNKKKFSISNKSPDEALHLLKGLALEIRKINPGEESQLNEAEREKIESLT